MRVGVIVQKFFCKNLGVSAISYCAVQAILDACHDLNRETELIVFTENSSQVIEYIEKQFKITKVKCYPIIEVRKIASYIEFAKNVLGCEVIFDTGLGDGFSDIYSSGRFLLQYFLKRIPQLLGKKVVLLPQTIGPYSKIKYEKMAAKVIKNCIVCFTRDEISYRYATKISRSSRIRETTDLAMRLPYDVEKYKDCFNNSIKKIGINVSGLLYVGGYTQNNQFGLTLDYKQFIDTLIEKIHSEFNCKIYIVSHVFLENKEGDQYAANALKMKSDYLELAPAFSSPLDAKSFISHMDAFIGSRMHSTIAALSSGVPVIPVGYSRKFNGLFESLGYRHYLDATNNDLIHGIEYIINELNNIDVLKADLLSAGDRIRSLNHEFKISLKSILEGI